jgi:hypothetical protein
MKTKINQNQFYVALFTTAIFLTSTTFSIAQEKTHKGFYLSMGLGPAFGDIRVLDNQSNETKIKGTGTGFDLQIGGAVKENLILHGTMGFKSIYGPTINGQKISGNYSIDESIFGAGMTYYLPNNFFFTGTIGSGEFSFTDEESSFATDPGFSFQLKAGKEWWVSSRWALGVVIEYGATSLNSRSGDGVEEKWNSNRFAVKFSATLNGKR